MSALRNLRRDLAQVLFRRGEEHPIPAMDGAFSPNDRLEALPALGEPVPGADDVAEGPDGALYLSAARQIIRLGGERCEERRVWATVEGDAGGLAWHPDGRLLVCVAGRGLVAIDPAGRQTTLADAEGEPLRCLTAVAVAPDGTVFAADGSTEGEPAAWCADLMAKRHAGRLVSAGPALDRATVLRRGLHYPAGLALSADGRSLWFTEAWTHRVSRAPVDGRRLGAATVVIGNLPGYPARLDRAGGGGFWLALFAVRTHLVEFVLREDDYRAEMLRTVPPHLWVAPALATSGHCHEPMQFGSIKALGIEKPWAPPRSYGLVARIDAGGEVAESLHSRVGGRAHGITAARQTRHGLAVVSKGSGRLLLDEGRRG